MLYELHEKTEQEGAKRKWSFFVVFIGQTPKPQQTPFCSGVWDPRQPHESQRVYQAARQEAQWEVERLNRNAKPPSRCL
jgi:hypothetical protein